MPEPVPAPTADQIASLRLIIRESYADTLSAVNGGDSQDEADANWAIAVLALELWEKQYVLGKQRKKRVGSIEWYEGGQVTPLDFVNNLRALYGFNALPTLSYSVGTDISSLPWF